MLSNCDLTLRRALLISEIARLENRSQKRAIRRAASVLSKGLTKDYKGLLGQLMAKDEAEIAKAIHASGLWGWDEKKGGEAYFK